MEGLSCFQYLEHATSVTEEGFGTMFDAPIMWLAVVTVQSCTDWTRILIFLTTLPFLGQLQHAMVEEVCQRRPKFRIYFFFIFFYSCLTSMCNRMVMTDLRFPLPTNAQSTEPFLFLHFCIISPPVLHRHGSAFGLPSLLIQNQFHRGRSENSDFTRIWILAAARRVDECIMNKFVGRYSKLKDSCRTLEGEGKWEENPMFEAAVQRFLFAESEQIHLPPQA